MRRYALYLCSTISICCVTLLAGSCSKERKPPPVRITSTPPPPATQKELPTSNRYYVIDRGQRVIFEIDLDSNKVARRFLTGDDVVAVGFDPLKGWLFEAIGGARPCLRVFEPRTERTIQEIRFGDRPSDLLFNPINRELYLISEDSSMFRVFSPDSQRVRLSLPLYTAGDTPIGPLRINPGPAGKLVTANGTRQSVTSILTQGKFMYQTIVNSDARSIDYAVFSFDGNSSFCVDEQRGKLYRIEFGSGNILVQKEGFKEPRHVQIEVTSNRVVLVTERTQLLFLSPDSLAEVGRLDLSGYGDRVRSLSIPPKANFAELTLDYGGVLRWLRLDVQKWKVLRLVELI